MSPSVLRRKLLRDLRGQRWQVLAVASVTFLGVCLFVASYLAYESLDHSYTVSQERTNLADMTLDVVRVTEAEVREVAALDGVAAADWQVVADLPVVVPDGVDPEGRRGRVLAEGRFITVPLGRQPHLNQVVVEEGSYPDAAGEVLVERHFADHHGLGPGSTLLLQTPAGDEPLTVSGVAVSPEYLWVARSRQDFLPAPAEFGVIFAPRETLAAAAEDLFPPDFATKAGNRLVYSLDPEAEADPDTVLERVKEVLGAANVLAATPRHKLMGIELLQMDLEGLRETAIAFPFFFLTVAAFIVAEMMNRRVDEERVAIGTMMATGVGRRAVLGHYGSFALLVGLLGAAPGAAVGLALGGRMAVLYATVLKIPFVTAHVDWLVVTAGLALGVGAALAPGLLAARRAAALSPAEAMRPFVQAGAGPGPGLRTHPTDRTGRTVRTRPSKLPLPLWLRLAGRNLVRHPVRTAGTALGVAAALVLIIATGGMLDSMDWGVRLVMEKSEVYDLRVAWLRPAPAADIRDAVSGIEGVDRLEVILALPVQVTRAEGGGEEGDGPASRTGETEAGEAYNTILYGLPAVGAKPAATGAEARAPRGLLNVVDSQGAILEPSRGQVVISSNIAAKLGVSPGDKVRLKLLPDGPELTATAGSLSMSLIGNSAAMLLEDVAAGFGLEGHANVVLVTTAPGKRVEVRDALQDLPGVARVSDAAAMGDLIRTALDLADIVLWVMLLFAVVLAAAILFNTATLSVLERRRELATMRAIGMRAARVGWLVTTENALIAALGLAAGFPLALAVLRFFVRLFASDLFTLPVHVHPRTVAAAFIGVGLTLLIAQRPSLRQVARMDLAESAKLRE